MLVTFRGRKSGREFTTPVRYLTAGTKIRCFTAATNRWWPNFLGGADICVRVRGRDIRCRAEAISGDAGRIRPALEDFLSHFPQDAAYYDVALDAKGNARAADLDDAATRTVMVEASPYA